MTMHTVERPTAFLGRWETGDGEDAALWICGTRSKENGESSREGSILRQRVGQVPGLVVDPCQGKTAVTRSPLLDAKYLTKAGKGKNTPTHRATDTVNDFPIHAEPRNDWPCLPYPMIRFG